MNVQSRTKAMKAIAGATLAIATLAVPAVAMQLDGKQDKPALVNSYAAPAPERFDLLQTITAKDPSVAAYPDVNSYPEEEGLYSSEEGHVLNDAWLGMTVVSQEGINLGYVTDAFIDENGDLDELVVIPADADSDVLATPVFVPARFAKLGGNAVNVNLTIDAFATLEPATEYAGLVE